jgi:hypothetical protein
MLDETGMLGMNKITEPQSKPSPAHARSRELPKIFCPDKMTPAEMAGAGVIMLGNIVFVSWWAMNEEETEVIEVIDPSSESAEILEQESAELPTSEASEGHTNTSILEIAEVSQEGTFKDAFDAARVQVGLGGVFEWRGQWYNTYTTEEWTGLDSVVQNDYFAVLKPFAESDAFLPNSIFHPYSAEIAHVEELHHHSSDLHHGDHTSGFTHPPNETHHDTFDEHFPNT